MPPLYVWCYQKIWYPFQRICRVSWWRTNFFFVFPLSKFKTRQFFSNTTLGIKPKLPPKLHVAKSPMSRLGMSLSSSNSTILTQSGPTKAREKEMYIKPWISATRTLCYLALNRQNKVADYLGTVTDQKLRKTNTNWVTTVWLLRLVDKPGNPEKTEKRTECHFCPQQETDKEQNFLLCCSSVCKVIRTKFFTKIKLKFNF